MMKKIMMTLVVLPFALQGMQGTVRRLDCNSTKDIAKTMDPHLRGRKITAMKPYAPHPIYSEKSEASEISYNLTRLHLQDPRDGNVIGEDFIIIADQNKEYHFIFCPNKPGDREHPTRKAYACQAFELARSGLLEQFKQLLAEIGNKTLYPLFNGLHYQVRASDGSILKVSTPEENRADLVLVKPSDSVVSTAPEVMGFNLLDPILFGVPDTRLRTKILEEHPSLAGQEQKERLNKMLLIANAENERLDEAQRQQIVPRPLIEGPAAFAKHKEDGTMVAHETVGGTLHILIQKDNVRFYDEQDKYTAKDAVLPATPLAVLYAKLILFSADQGQFILNNFEKFEQFPFLRSDIRNHIISVLWDDWLSCLPIVPQNLVAYVQKYDIRLFDCNVPLDICFISMLLRVFHNRAKDNPEWARAREELYNSLIKELKTKTFLPTYFTSDETAFGEVMQEDIALYKKIGRKKAVEQYFEQLYAKNKESWPLPLALTQYIVSFLDSEDAFRAWVVKPKALAETETAIQTVEDGIAALQVND